MKAEKIPVGLDMVDGMPDYTKSLEENKAIYRQRFFEVYGVYPEDLEDGQLSEDKKKAQE
ncbi:MAG: hypothetical protein HPY71_01630 [Firmicutes bacterium]|nr:hypothetical protein [Bacillota bacterium]